MTQARIGLLEALGEEDRARLFERAVPRHIAPGGILFLAGERGRRAYLVKSGVIKLTARDGEGRETILALAIPGDLVGDLAALDDLPQPVDSIAATPCDVLGIDAGLLGDMVARNPAAALALGRAIASRLRWVCDTALERTSVEVPARLAGRLLDLADLLGRISNGTVEVDMPLAQTDLGRLAGMCRESACKTMRQFKQKGFVDYEGRRLRILRPDLLERIRTGTPLTDLTEVPSPPHIFPKGNRVRTRN